MIPVLHLLFIYSDSVALELTQCLDELRTHVKPHWLSFKLNKTEVRDARSRELRKGRDKTQRMFKPEFSYDCSSEIPESS